MPRFAWTPERDALLRTRWLAAAPLALAATLGCSLRSIYKRAAELHLPARDPVARALRAGEAPGSPGRAITLPTIDLPEVADGAAGDGFRFVHMVETFR